MPFLEHDLRGAQHALVLALGVDRRACGFGLGAAANIGFMMKPERKTKRFELSR